VHGTVSAPTRPLLVTFGSILRPDGGLQVRARVLAEDLASLGMPASVVSTRERVSLTPPPAWLRSLHVTRRKPRRGFSLELAALIQRAAADSDMLILTNAMFMPALALSGVRLPVVWDTNECQTLHYSRLRPSAPNQAKHLAWRALEHWAATRCSVAVASGAVEAAVWRALGPLQGRVAIVDHAAFVQPRAPAVAREELGRWLPQSSEGPVLVFVGTLAAKHNAAAADWICRVLRPTLPAGTTIVLCGSGTECLRPAPRGAQIIGLGVVDDVDSVIAAADVCLAPLASGAGVKTKVLHYLAHGRRVAGTAVAFEGLGDAPGLHEAALTALPALVGRLLAEPESPEAEHRRAAAQRAWVEAHHGRAHVREQWKELLQCPTPG
jgi:Glycosyl transferases group 1